MKHKENKKAEDWPTAACTIINGLLTARKEVTGQMKTNLGKEIIQQVTYSKSKKQQGNLKRKF